MISSKKWQRAGGAALTIGAALQIGSVILIGLGVGLFSFLIWVQFLGGLILIGVVPIGLQRDKARESERKMWAILNRKHND